MNDLDYSIMATARVVAVKNLQHPVSTGQLVAAYVTLTKFGWLSGRIDPATDCTARPTNYTNAELAIVIAELDGRKGGPYYSSEEWKAIEQDAREMGTQGEALQQGATDDSGPAWPAEDMAAWNATRAADEKRALEVNALCEREREATGPGGTDGASAVATRRTEAAEQKRPQGGGDPGVEAPPGRPLAKRQRTAGREGPARPTPTDHAR